MKRLPPPSCTQGYTQDDLRTYLGPLRWLSFNKWIAGQTCPGCNGQLYNHNERRYEPTACINDPHGLVYYTSDVRQFLAGGKDLEWVGT